MSPRPKKSDPQPVAHIPIVGPDGMQIYPGTPIPSEWGQEYVDSLQSDGAAGPASAIPTGTNTTDRTQESNGATVANIETTDATRARIANTSAIE